MLVLDSFFNELPNNSFKVVFPQLPVIATIFVLIFSCSILKSEAQVKDTLRWSMEGNIGFEATDFFYQSGGPDWDALTLKQNQMVQPGT